MLQRICHQCSAKGTSALSLLNETSHNVLLTPQISQDPYYLKQQKHHGSSDGSSDGACGGELFGNRIRYLPTGITSLDNSLRGGIRVGAVTELVGRAGTGKTQFAFQLCVLAAKYNQGALYIDTERKIVLERLAEMSRARVVHQQYEKEEEAAATTTTAVNGIQDGKIDHFSYNESLSCPTLSSGSSSIENNLNAINQQQDGQSKNVDSSTHHNKNSSSNNNSTRIFAYKQSETVFANLTVETPASTQELLNTLDSAEEIILHRNQEAALDVNNKKYPVRLLIVDSIAAPMRRDFGSDSAPQRSAAVFKCAQTLKRLAETLHLAVIVINQVGANNTTRSTTSTDNFDSNSNIITQDQGMTVKAALGVSWHHCVSTRLFLQHEMNHNHHHHQEFLMGQSHHHQASAMMMAGSQQQTHVNNSNNRNNNSRIESRSVSIVKSNMAPFSISYFEIKTFGIAEASAMAQQQGKDGYVA